MHILDTIQRVALFLVATVALPAQVVVTGVTSIRPDYSELYERLSRSDWVVIGKVVDRKMVSKRSLADIQPTMDASGKPTWFVPMQDVMAGDLYTLAVERPLCRKAYFVPSTSAPAENPHEFKIFFAYRETDVPSDLYPERTIFSPNGLVEGQRYLFYLVAQPDDANARLVREYELEPSITYYRLFEGSRGARPFRIGATGPEKADSIPADASAIASVCQALSAPALPTKISELKALVYSSEPPFREAVAKILRAIEQGSEK